MILKSDIEKAFREQRAFLTINKDFIKRAYSRKIPSKSRHIEVISGVRRCGKSTLLKQLISARYKKYAYFNFEDSRIFGFDVKDFKKLDDVMGNGLEAYFFDEIQNVPSWEIFVRQLHDRGEKVFITGSNASLLSRELGTRLTGRHIRHELFPFSYAEYLTFRNRENTVSEFDAYLNEGGFPEYVESGETELLQNLLRDIVLRDIALRHGIRNTKSLMDITLFLVSNIGKEITYNRLRKSFDIGSAGTVSDYLSWMEDSYLFNFLPRFSWSAKSSAVNPRKVYAVDNGFVNANSLSFSKDTGRKLENAVYQFLRQQGYTLYYYREKHECDFVIFETRHCKMLLQVCVEVTGDNYEREMNGLTDAMNFFDKKSGCIITRDQSDILTANGKKIHLLPAHQFFITGIID